VAHINRGGTHPASIIHPRAACIPLRASFSDRESEGTAFGTTPDKQADLRITLEALTTPPISRARSARASLTVKRAQIITLRDGQGDAAGRDGGAVRRAKVQSRRYNVTEIVPPPGAVTGLEMQLSLSARAIFSAARRANRAEGSARGPRPRRTAGGHRALAASSLAIIIIYRVPPRRRRRRTYPRLPRGNPACPSLC